MPEKYHPNPPKGDVNASGSETDWPPLFTLEKLLEKFHKLQGYSNEQPPEMISSGDEQLQNKYRAGFFITMNRFVIELLKYSAIQQDQSIVQRCQNFIEMATNIARESTKSGRLITSNEVDEAKYLLTILIEKLTAFKKL